MTDIARLGLEVDPSGVIRALNELKQLENQGEVTEKSTNKVTGSFKNMIAPVAALVSASAGLNKIVSVTREFNVLEAQLITATGSATNASEAFDSIQAFAEQTPYDLQQATSAFTQLVNLGLTPSQEAMMSYGNTASALGKDLNQMIEAVADAAAGEFERLKEFGIKTKKQGDDVAFTFRGVTTTVRNNAEEIEQYLMSLGQNEFDGAMIERMNTLDGAISNLGDEWDKLFLNISEQGAGDAIESAVRVGVDALAELNAMLASGELQAYIGAIADKFDWLAEDIDAAFSFVEDIIHQSSETWGEDVSSTVDFISDAFVNLPENVRAIVQLITIELASIADYGSANGKAYVKAFGVELALLVDKAGFVAKELADKLNPFDGDTFDYDAAVKKASTNARELTNSYFDEAKRQSEATRQARMLSIDSILVERDTAIDSYNDQIDGAKKLRQEYDNARKARLESDSLAQFKSSGDASSSSQGQGGGKKKKGKTNEPDTSEFDRLVDSLRSEEEVIQDSYDRRLQIILANTEANSVKQLELIDRLKSDFGSQALGGFLSTEESFDEELERLNERYERRKQLILDNVALTETERTELEEELIEARNRKVDEIEGKRRDVLLKSNSELFGDLAGLAKTFAGEQSGIYKALFAASKAFSIAQSVINIQTAISEAATLKFPANLAAMATVASETAGIISTIKGTKLSFDGGGYTGDGPRSGGVDGKGGFHAILHPQETVIDHTKQVSSGKSAGSPITIINQGAPLKVVKDSVSNNERQIIVAEAVEQSRQAVANDMHSGGNDVADAIEANYSLQRSTRR